MSKFLKLPEGFKPHKGLCSWDQPQELYALDDYDEVEVIRRNGDIETLQILDINWVNTFEKTDIVGYRRIPPDEIKSKNRKKTKKKGKGKRKK
jgi:hypothetical protein